MPGVIFKLKLAGVPRMDFAAMRVLGWIYTAVVLVATAWLAVRARPHGREPIVWLVVLFLATMRSPFLPTYAAFPTLWLMTLVVATSRAEPGLARAAIGVGVLLSLSWGIGYLPPLVNATWTTLQTIAAFVLAAMTCRTFRERDRAADPVPASTAPLTA